MAEGLHRVLVVGIPRSGTTWVGHVLGNMTDTSFLGEPDNHLAFPYAFRAKRRLPGGFYPMLGHGDVAEAYERLWRAALPDRANAELGYGTVERTRRAIAARLLAAVVQRDRWDAFAGRRVALRLLAAERLAVPERPLRTGSHLVVKSVFAPLSIEWVASRFPVCVVIVSRAPLNVLSSWAEMGWLGRPGDDMLDTLGEEAQRKLATRWGVPPPDPGSSVFVRAAWMIAALSAELDAAIQRNPGWIAVSHEDLAENPHHGFRALSAASALPWASRVDEMLDEMNRPGRGYDLQRVGRELRDAWRSRLADEHVFEARTVLERFPLARIA